MRPTARGTGQRIGYYMILISDVAHPPVTYPLQPAGRLLQNLQKLMGQLYEGEITIISKGKRRILDLNLAFYLHISVT